jgi:hypothetical protein
MPVSSFFSNHVRSFFQLIADGDLVNFRLGLPSTLDGGAGDDSLYVQQGHDNLQGQGGSNSDIATSDGLDVVSNVEIHAWARACIVPLHAFVCGESEQCARMDRRHDAQHARVGGARHPEASSTSRRISISKVFVIPRSLRSPRLPSG